MRVSRSAAYLSTLLTVPTLVNAVGNLDCNQIVASGVEWNLGKLGGVHTVHYLERTDAGKVRNLTFHIDICKPLKPAGRPCPMGSRICAYETFQKDELPGSEKPDRKWPIAGDYTASNGRALNARPERIKDSNSNRDSDDEGVRISLEGGIKGRRKQQTNQKAIIEFLCRPRWNGNELPKNNSKRKREDNEDDPLPNPDRGQALQFVSYKPEQEQGKKEGAEVLRLMWRTKFACENSDEKGGKGGKGGDSNDKGGDETKSGRGWGFFTWFIIILFLAVAAYLIFGSWLNYNRYGARGWDLLPHGDTIRDVPYLLKEWGRRVASVGGSRDLGYIRV